jgi:hypothetical protein
MDGKDYRKLTDGEVIRVGDMSGANVSSSSETAGCG